MKANEFVKENGIEKCKRILDDLTDQGHNGDFYKELKRLVESHELILRCGGLHMAKADVMDLDGWEKTSPHWVKIKQAILDVESCQ